VIVVGAGLAGLAAAAEAGRRVLLPDQEPEQSPGAQAWWSFGGLFSGRIAGRAAAAAAVR